MTTTDPPTSDQGDAAALPGLPDQAMVTYLRGLRTAFDRMLMEHRFAAEEVLTKVSILREEFLHLHRYNPIEHVSSRIKTPESILGKVDRRGLDPEIASIRANITDIAGVRITCSFIADTYRVLEALTSQADVRVLEVKDYIATPKPNGYKSLHAIIEIPVFLSDGPVPIAVEVQVRTIAMDFWASLEHKIFYKYSGAVPEHLDASLKEAAEIAERLDRRMEELHQEVHAKADDTDGPATEEPIDEAVLRRLWELSRRG